MMTPFTVFDSEERQGLPSVVVDHAPSAIRSSCAHTLSGECMFRFIRSPLLLVLALAVSSGAATAKTLVFCSEGSPEGFDPALYTAGTTFDASSKPVYNRLLAFRRGTTDVIPSLAESAVGDSGMGSARPTTSTSDGSRRTPAIVSFHGILHADASLQCRRCDLLVRAPAQERSSVESVRGWHDVDIVRLTVDARSLESS